MLFFENNSFFENSSSKDIPFSGFIMVKVSTTVVSDCKFGFNWLVAGVVFVCSFSVDIYLLLSLQQNNIDALKSRVNNLI